MEFFECTTAREVGAACDSFYSQLMALNDAKAVSDTSAMFNSIKGAASIYDSKIGRAIGGKIWVAKNEHDQVIGLMRLKDQGTCYHLGNLVGIPRAGGGAALLQLAKAISLSCEKELRLEAADKALIRYYTERCFRLDKGESGMVWHQDVD